MPSVTTSRCMKLAGAILWMAAVWPISVVFCQVGAQCDYNKISAFSDCSSRNLTSVPDHITSFSKVIDLSHNDIHRIDGHSFNGSAFVFVAEIYLAGNNLMSVAYDAFAHLRHLQLLDLSHNRLTAFHVDAPISLQVLYLDYNPLGGHNLFQQRIHFFKYLSLVGANLTEPPAALFSPFLPVLEFLDLQDNPSLDITVDHLPKLKHLRVLYLSPRIFVARAKLPKCKEFVRRARELKIEVKAFACYPEEPFQIKARSFERTYQVDEAMYDHPENVLTFPTPTQEDVRPNETCLHDLQKVVSNGMSNFIRSLLVAKMESRPLNYKIKDPIHLEDYWVAVPRSRLFNVHMTGFPLFNPQKEPKLGMSTVDAEYVKYFQTEYESADTNRDVVIGGQFEVDRKFGNFSCKFKSTHYYTKRAMVRRYDFRVWPRNVHERFGFEKMDCSTSMSNQYTSNVIEMTLASMSKNWLDSACAIGGIVIVQPALLNVSQWFSASYRDRVLEEVIRQSIDYLRHINVNSFDVTPSLNLKENGVETSIPEMTYNIKINNLFGYANRNVKYVTTDAAHSTKVRVEAVIGYKDEDAAKLAITAASDPSEVMLLHIRSIEFELQLEVKRVNRVHKLEIGDVTVNVVEKPTRQHATFVLSFVKKYLDMELAKEFKRSLIFLTSQVDFYSLNVA